MEARTGSMTVAALVGTGLATIGFALGGVSALGDDLQAARLRAPAPATLPAPILSPSEEAREAAPDAATHPVTLERICDQVRGPRAGRGGPADPQPTTPAKEL